MTRKYLDDLTAEYVRSILDYDPETGVFRWRRARGNRGAGAVAGGPSNYGYTRIAIDGRLYLASRLAWLVMKGRWPRRDVDHKDTNRANDRWKNFRLATRPQNCCNARIGRRNTSGVKGVSRTASGKKWRACASVGGRQYSFGSHDTIEAAAAAHADGIKNLHGRFARAESRLPAPLSPEEN